MLTKQTILTQTGSGTNVRYYTSREKPTGKSICGDLHAIKHRSAGTAGGAEDQRYQETKSPSDGSTNKPIRAQKVTTGKTATKTNL
jgi:hypothetical protein